MITASALGDKTVSKISLVLFPLRLVKRGVSWLSTAMAEPVVRTVLLRALLNTPQLSSTMFGNSAFIVKFTGVFSRYFWAMLPKVGSKISAMRNGRGRSAVEGKTALMTSKARSLLKSKSSNFMLEARKSLLRACTASRRKPATPLFIQNSVMKRNLRTRAVLRLSPGNQLRSAWAGLKECR